MKFRYFILVCLISFLVASSFSTFAQRHNMEFGGTLAISQYNGDLKLPDGFHPDKYAGKMQFGGGIIYRYYFNPWMNFKANLFYGQFAGADWEDQPHVTGHPWNRNLSFKTYIVDISPQLEINILPFISGKNKKNWAPYIFGGIALFSFNPKAELNGKWYYLQPLGTEGQGTLEGGPKYKLTAFSIPYGVGLKYGFKKPYRYHYRNGRRPMTLEGWNIGIELTQRKTFTDHIDDVGGFYPKSILVFGTNTIAAQLCDRSGERNGGVNTRIKENATVLPERGHKAYDTYMWYGITVTYTFRKNGNMRFY